MEARGLSQSELGRRVGVSQATIYKLLVGESFGTRHLHKIARELLTTPAYLAGETDDPEEGAPAPPELRHEERELLEFARGISAPNRAALMQLVRALPKDELPAAAANREEVSLPPERALAEMFEALLTGIDHLPKDEKARFLAQRLPIGLSQLRDLMPPFQMPARTRSPSSPPTPVPSTR